MTPRFPYLLFLVCLLCLAPALPSASHAGASPAFIENKGQWPASFPFMTEVKGGYMWFGPGSFRVKLGQPLHRHPDEKEHAEAPKSRGHAYELLFAGGHAQKIAPKGEALPTRYNFFLGNDPKKWASDARAFPEIHYSGLYPGVDLRLYHHAGHLKYDLQLAKARDIGQVRMRYQGIDKIRLEKGRLLLETSVGTIEESIPLAYQIVGGKRIPLPCRYRVNGREIGFEFPRGYRKELPLVVDPQVVFYTFSGGASDNWANTAVGDPFGNSFLAGTVYGPIFPTTLGAFDRTYNGEGEPESSYDVGIQKFNPAGNQLLFCTFLGGRDAESPHAINVDANDNLILFGSTSSQNFPTTAGAFQTQFGGGVTFSPLLSAVFGYQYDNGSDIFVCRLSTNGNALLASTYLGGSANDGVVALTDSLSMNYGDCFRGDVAVAPDGGILIASATYSPNFPTTPQAFQPQLRRSMDGVVVKLNAGLSALDWSTYLGGSRLDALYSIQMQGTNNVVVCGGSKSQDFPISPGAYQASITGINNRRNSFCDAVVASFSVGSGALLRSTFSGTNAYDQAYLVQTDPEGNVYLFGQTEGIMPRSPGRYGQTNGRMFVQKLDPTLSNLIWGTTLGSSPTSALVPSAFLVDTCGRIYLSGWGGTTNFPAPNNTGGNTNGFPTTSNAFKSTSDGSDFYFCVLGPEAESLDFGSFYGGSFRGEHVDGGMSRFDRSGTITQAICGCTDQNGSFFPGTPGSYSPSILGNNCNQGVVKINLGTLLANFRFESELGCGRTITLQNLSSNGVRYTWFWGNGDSLSSNSPTVQYTYPTEGTYIITLKASNQATCKKLAFFSDTVEIRNPFPFPVDTLEVGICSRRPFSPQVPAYPNITQTWLPDPDIVNQNLVQPLLNPTIGKVYTLENRTPEGCRQLRYFTVRLLSDLVLAISDSLAIQRCDSVGTLYLRALGNGSEWFRWKIGAQRSDGPEWIYPISGGDEEISVQLNGLKNTCPDSVRKRVLIPQSSLKPLPDFGVQARVESCDEKRVYFQNTTLRAALYEWDFGDGNRSTAARPSHRYEREGRYWVSLKAKNENCEATTGQWLDYQPLIIPNLLTADGNGRNDRFEIPDLVPGTGLDIFNRWGKKVFSSGSYTNDWSAKDLEPGTYFFQLRFPGGHSCRSWVQVLR